MARRGSNAYTHGHHASVVKHHARRTAANSAAFLLPHLQKDQKLLDVGCGPGSITIGLADYVACAVGVDYSDEVVQEARDAAASKDNLDFIAASVYELPFPDNNFDVVFTHQVLQHLPDPVGALREMLRVTKPGGMVASREAVCSTYQMSPALPALERWREVYASIAHRNSAEPDAGLFLKQWFLDAGLAQDRIHYGNSVVTYSSSDESSRRAYGEAWVDRALQSSFAKQAIQYAVASSEELTEISQGWQAWAANPNSVLFYVNGEVIARKDAKLPEPSHDFQPGALAQVNAALLGA